MAGEKCRGCLSVATSFVVHVDTKLGLTQGILREKPELVASAQGGEAGTPVYLKALKTCWATR